MTCSKWGYCQSRHKSLHPNLTTWSAGSCHLVPLTLLAKRDSCLLCGSDQNERSTDWTIRSALPNQEWWKIGSSRRFPTPTSTRPVHSSDVHLLKSACLKSGRVCSQQLESCFICTLLAGCSIVVSSQVYDQQMRSENFETQVCAGMLNQCRPDWRVQNMSEPLLAWTKYRFCIGGQHHHRHLDSLMLRIRVSMLQAVHFCRGHVQNQWFIETWVLHVSENLRVSKRDVARAW